MSKPQNPKSPQDTSGPRMEGVAKAVPHEKGETVKAGLGQMENIIMAFADKNGFQVRPLGAQTEDARAYVLYLYTGQENNATVNVGVKQENEGHSRLTLTNSEPILAQHKDVGDSLVQYVQDSLKQE